MTHNIPQTHRAQPLAEPGVPPPDVRSWHAVLALFAQPPRPLEEARSQEKLRMVQGRVTVRTGMLCFKVLRCIEYWQRLPALFSGAVNHAGREGPLLVEAPRGYAICGEMAENWERRFPQKPALRGVL
jgi:hypothetical protein